jgi:hypothetical protein
MVFGKKTLTELIKDVEQDPNMTKLDVSGNASIQMKSTEFLTNLADALKKHKGIKEVNLMECEITDPGCEVLAGVLAENHTIEELNLEKNKITSTGAAHLAEGLSKNCGLRTLNLLQQQGNWGEDCLARFLAMFAVNVTLTKIKWRIDSSRKSFDLNKFQTRNGEIRKRVDKGEDYKDYLPDHLKASPPDLSKSGDEIAAQLSKAGNGYSSSTDRDKHARETRAWPEVSAPEKTPAPAPEPSPSAESAVETEVPAPEPSPPAPSPPAENPEVVQPEAEQAQTAAPAEDAENPEASAA